jgi:thiazole synthase
MDDSLVIAGRRLRSRFFVGTGKFPSNAAMLAAIEASGAEIVTVALRRLDLGKERGENITDALDPEKYLVLANTSGAADAQEAVTIARLAYAAGMPKWIKLEIHPDPRWLLPDPIETLKAAEILVKEGFVVMPYINADPVLAKRLEEVGCACVMPLGAPIGCNQGIQTREMIKIIIEQSRIPVVIDAGLGAPSHASEAMELGADAVLVNTALAAARDPAAMGRAFALAVEAGRLGRRAGLAGKSAQAHASSPLTSFLKG